MSVQQTCKGLSADEFRAPLRRGRTRRFAAAAAVVCTVFATRAERTSAADPGPPPMFPKGSMTLDATIACTVAGGDADALPAAQLGVNYFVFDNLSLGAQVTAYGVFQEGDDTYAAGIAGVLRHHLFRWDDTTLFADVSFGPFEAADDAPAGGTRFNFTTRAGLGITHRLNEDMHLMAGARYFHLSNARIEGAANNPAINGVEFYGGLVWSW